MIVNILTNLCRRTVVLLLFSCHASVAGELYNGHLWTDDPGTRQRNLLVAVDAHFEARKPLDKLAAMVRSSGFPCRVQLKNSCGVDLAE